MRRGRGHINATAATVRRAAQGRLWGMTLNITGGRRSDAERRR